MAIAIRPKKNRRSTDIFSGDSPKKGSSYCYDRIYAWIAGNRSGNRAIYLSTRVRTANLSITDVIWIFKTLTSVHTERTEIQTLLAMPAHIRGAIQKYHDLARQHGMILTSKRDPSELIAPQIRDGVSTVLDIAREQLCIVFDVEEPTREVSSCIEILEQLLTSGGLEESGEAISNGFILCLLLSLRGNNPVIFHGAHTVDTCVWALVMEMLRGEDKVITC